MPQPPSNPPPSAAVVPTRRRGTRRLMAAAAASVALHLLLARGLAVTHVGLDGTTPAPAAAPPKPRRPADFPLAVPRSAAERRPAHARPVEVPLPAPTSPERQPRRPERMVAERQRAETPQTWQPAEAQPVERTARPQEADPMQATAPPERRAAAAATPRTSSTADTSIAAAAAAGAAPSDLAAVGPAQPRPRDRDLAAAARWRPREAELLGQLAAPTESAAPARVARDRTDDRESSTSAAPATSPARRAAAGGATSAATSADPLPDAAATIGIDAPATAPTGPPRRAAFSADRRSAAGRSITAASAGDPADSAAPPSFAAPAVGLAARRSAADSGADGASLAATESSRPSRAATAPAAAGTATADVEGIAVAAGPSDVSSPAPGPALPSAAMRLAAVDRGPTVRPATADDAADDDEGLSVPPPATQPVLRPRRDVQADDPAVATIAAPARVAAVALPTEGRVRDVAEAFARRTAPRAIGRDGAPGDLDGRLPANRAAALVDLGLGFLARSQQADGRWSLGRFAGSGPADVPKLSSDTAATGLALLSFLGAGHDHFDGPHRDTVRRGLEFLLAAQKPDGDLYVPADDLSNSCAWLYSHGIAAIALCEAVGMTGDPLVRPAAEKACGFIATSQHPSRGGWRYTPGSDADLSVSGWMLVAVRSGQLAGVKTDPRTLDGVRALLDAAAMPGSGGRYAYNPRNPRQRQAALSTACMTAVGALMRLHTGTPTSDPRIREAAAVLAPFRPSYGTAEQKSRDSYLWYYASQVLVHTGGAPWDSWYSALVDVLAGTQQRSGPQAGSWDPLGATPDRWGPYGGRLYVTALHLLALEVPARHLPTYTASDAARP